MNEISISSPGNTAAFVRSQPVAPSVGKSGSNESNPVPSNSFVPSKQSNFFGVPGGKGSDVPGSQASKNPLLTFTGLPFLSNEMFPLFFASSGAPVLSIATYESLYGLHTKSM